MPGSAAKPFPGWDFHVLNDNNEECAPGELGKLVIKLPMPPAFMLTLWNNEAGFIDTYMTETPGYYTTGDAAFKDANGYFHIMSRIDDIVWIYGNRFTSGAIEEVVNSVPGVVESAAIGYIHMVRGESPLVFIVLEGSHQRSI